AGGGATTPLTGFGYTIATGVREAVDEKGLLGAFTGGLSATSAGIASAIIFGFIASLIFSSKPKR
ncbi:MAG: SpoVA/SpoVAEb family sporulation membrane protein, partial [Clostridia bacterium]|nr:SpoVA/SpoVAEb family sporulation membrane protein [Clostridia bacterium]